MLKFDTQSVVCANSSAYHKTNDTFPLLVFVIDHLQDCQPESDEVSAFLFVDFS